MTDTITIAEGDVGCPQCGRHPTVRHFALIACRECGIAWGDGFDEIDMDDVRENVNFLATCDWRAFLRPGILPCRQNRICRWLDSRYQAPCLVTG